MPLIESVVKRSLKLWMDVKLLQFAIVLKFSGEKERGDYIQIVIFIVL